MSCRCRVTGTVVCHCTVCCEDFSDEMSFDHHRTARGACSFVGLIHLANGEWCLPASASHRIDMLNRARQARTGKQNKE